MFEKEDRKNNAGRLFYQFNAYLASQGLILNEGKIVDASFVVSPRQCNNPVENAAPL